MIAVISTVRTHCEAGHLLQFVDEVYDAEAGLFVGELQCDMCGVGYLDRRMETQPRRYPPVGGCRHAHVAVMPCQPRESGCDHDQVCTDCGRHVGVESWNFWATKGARADHDRRYNSVDNTSTVCETAAMPRKKRGLPPATTTAAGVLDELTAAAETVREADDAGADYATVTERLTTLVPLVKSAHEAGIPVPVEVLARLPTLGEIVGEYKTRHERKADDEKALTVLRTAVLDTLDDPAWNTEGVDDAPGDGFVLRRKPMPGRDKLDVALLAIALVEKGLDPKVVGQVIEDCTVTGDPYFELRVVTSKEAAQ